MESEEDKGGPTPVLNLVLAGQQAHYRRALWHGQESRLRLSRFWAGS